MKTNTYIQSLGDKGTVELIHEVQRILQTEGVFTTGEIIDLMLDPLETSVVVKARVAILVQTIIKNMQAMR